jgi:hypothetical protein
MSSSDTVRDSERDSDFILGLEENAIDSLVHAVEHFLDEEKPTNLKYTVLHVFHAVELFLKARLAKAGITLIYRKENSEKTLGYHELIRTLEKHNVSLSEEDKTNLSELKKLRDKIEHHRIEHNRNDIKNYIGCAIYFLESFLQRELGISLKEKIDEVDYDAYKILSMTYLYHWKRMEDSGISLHPKEIPNIQVCLECGENALVVPDPRATDSSSYCFCCFSRYIVNYCPMCEMESIDYDSVDRSASKIEVPGDFEGDAPVEQDDWASHWGFCENCLDRIEASP